MYGIYGNKSKEDKHKDPILTIPDHRYIGPGNTVDDTVPHDKDDQIALEHDRDYEKVISKQAVQAADDVAIHHFLDDFIHSGNLHSGLGAAGLGIKRGFETVAGVQYPSE